MAPWSLHLIQERLLEVLKVKTHVMDHHSGLETRRYQETIIHFLDSEPQGALEWPPAPPFKMGQNVLHHARVCDINDASLIGKITSFQWSEFNLEIKNKVYLFFQASHEWFYLTIVITFENKAIISSDFFLQPIM